MRIFSIIWIIVLSISLISCTEKLKKKKQLNSENTSVLNPEIDAIELKSDFNKWWTYHSNYISLNNDFTGVDENSDTIPKKQFLEKLTSGKYIPLKIKSKEIPQIYKLEELEFERNNSIQKTIVNESLTSLKYLKMAGNPFPDFEFFDLDGNKYTNETIKGKTTLLKTWFIRCKACIAEFPELNNLEKHHSKKNDFIFLSLALDTKTELREFLKKTEFRYKVIPHSEYFIQNNLDLHMYPTHIIIDENGLIKKVSNKASEMIEFLEQEQKNTDKLPPPPPS